MKSHTPEPTSSETTASFRVFLTLWLGQSVSQLGSQLTGFVLGVWVYQQTGSATDFALVTFCIVVPQMVVLPFAGALIDRWNRRRVMLLSDTGAGLCTILLFLLVADGRLSPGLIYVLTALSSCFTAFQSPAFYAATAQLVEKKHLVRANGLIELGVAGAMMIAPVAAGAMLDQIGIVGVIGIDLISFFFAAGTLLWIRIPDLPARSAKDRAHGDEDESSKPGLWAGLWSDTAFGWTYVRQRQGLMGLLALFAALNLILGMVQVSFTPLVLSFATAKELGWVLAVAVAGMVAGSSAVVAWGGPERKMRAVFMLLVVQGAILFLGGVRPNLWLICTAAFVYMACQPIIMASSQAIWQTKVEASLHGRVFAIRRWVANGALPVAYLTAGLSVDHLFEPALAPDGALAGSLGLWMGTGPGRGIGLLLILLGVASFGVLALGLGFEPLRRLETLLPDAEPSAEPSPPSPLSLTRAARQRERGGQSSPSSSPCPSDSPSGPPLPPGRGVRGEGERGARPSPDFIS